MQLNDKRFRVVLSVLCLSFASIFIWGYWGFFEYGSSGLPPAARINAIWVGAVLYTGFLVGLSAFLTTSPDDYIAAFGARVVWNLKWTAIALLACFPAAFVFIGLLAPPFIVLWSAILFSRTALLDEKALRAKYPYARKEMALDESIERHCAFCKKITPKSDPICIWCHRELDSKI